MPILGIMASSKLGAPTSPVAGYTAWFDAADTATITVSGSAVSQWNDKSANAYNLTQGTAANRPLSGTRTINSKNVIDFDGTNDFLIASTASNWTFLNNSTGSSSFIVLFSDTTSNTGFIASTAGGSSGNIGLDWIRNGSDDLVRVFVRNSGLGGAVGSLDQGLLTDNTAVYYTMLLTPNNGTTADRAISRVNGGAEIKNNSVSNSPNNGTPTQALVLGAADNAGSAAFDGTIGEVIFYNSVLSATDRALNESYLKNKWGL